MHEFGESHRRRTATSIDRDLAQGQAAVELVACGAAVRVQLHGLRYAERIAAALAATAQQAGVGFHLEHNESGTCSLFVGPRLAPDVAT